MSFSIILYVHHNGKRKVKLKDMRLGYPLPRWDTPYRGVYSLFVWTEDRSVADKCYEAVRVVARKRENLNGITENSEEFTTKVKALLDEETCKALEPPPDKPVEKVPRNYMFPSREYFP